MAGRVYERVLAQILEQIKNGTIKEGSRLPPERDLAIQYNVSRGSLREALRILEQDGYIESIQGGGRVLIRSRDDRDVADGMTRRLGHTSMNEYIELRETLDLLIVVKACEHATQEDIEEIRRAIKKSSQSFTKPENQALALNQVNAAIAKATHNSLLQEIYQMFYEFIPKVRMRAIKTKEERLASLREHNQILYAIEKRDPVMAELAARIHIHHIRDRMKLEGIEGLERSASASKRNG